MCSPEDNLGIVLPMLSVGQDLSLNREFAEQARLTDQDPLNPPALDSLSLGILNALHQGHIFM